LLQCCAAVAGWDRFLCLYLSIFGLDFFFHPPWFWVNYNDSVTAGAGLLFFVVVVVFALIIFFFFLFYLFLFVYYLFSLIIVIIEKKNSLLFHLHPFH
jgi:hypothetical protein